MKGEKWKLCLLSPKRKSLRLLKRRRNQWAILNLRIPRIEEQERGKEGEGLEAALLIKRSLSSQMPQTQPYLKSFSLGVMGCLWTMDRVTTMGYPIKKPIMMAIWRVWEKPLSWIKVQGGVIIGGLEGIPMKMVHCQVTTMMRNRLFNMKITPIKCLEV